MGCLARLAIVVLTGVACSPAPKPIEPPPLTTATSKKNDPSSPSTSSSSSPSLSVDPVALFESDRPVAIKIARGPFQYFRYTNRPFVDMICARYKSTIPDMPLVHAHGDAHLEQYAVAAEGRGLSDFDASALGPPVVDLVRYATSVVLAADQDGKSGRTAIDAFVNGYALALDDPNVSVPEPQVAVRLRSRFAKTRTEWLDSVQRLIIPTPPEDQVMYDQGWADFISQMRAKDPAIKPAFFKIKVGGRLEMGVGSAHAAKFLARVEGPTPAPDDDLVIEAKAVTPDMLGSCMQGASLDATRVIKGQAQISNAPQRYLAAVKINGKPFYSHTWLVHYTELSIHDVRTPEELAEVSKEIGIQLGRGHAKMQEPSRVPAQRQALKSTLATITPTLGDVATELATSVKEAWSQYRDRLPVK
jgi:hypothetical protein